MFRVGKWIDEMIKQEGVSTEEWQFVLGVNYGNERYPRRRLWMLKRKFPHGGQSSSPFSIDGNVSRQLQ